MDLFNRQKPNSSEYIVANVMLTAREFRKIVREGRIDKDTKVRRKSDHTWINAGDIEELSIYFEEKRAASTEDSKEFILDSIQRITGEVQSSLDALFREKVEIPEQLYETLNDYLDKGTGEVALSMGKVNEQPAFIVITISQNQEPEIVAEIEIDTSNWRERSIQEWPQTGSKQAKIWQITRK